MNPSEQAIIAATVAECALRLGRGDLSALGTLYDATAPRLLRFAETLSRNRADAEDALQATMVRVAEKPACLAAADRPWAYFLRIVRNETLKIVSRRKPVQTSSQVEVWAFDDKTSQRDEWRSHVHQALAQLPPKQAEVVVLKIWEEMTFAEIGTVLGESPNTAASRYRYAMSKLAQYLAPLAEEVRDE